MVRRIFLAVAFLIMIWGLLVFALPGVVQYMPSWCAYWGVADGICGEGAQDTLRSTDEWVKQHLQPFARSEHYAPLLARAYDGLSVVRGEVESEEDNGKVKAAMSHIDRSLITINERLEQQEVTKKVQDVPGNAKEMLASASQAAAQLRVVLEETHQKAEAVRDATQNMQNALDRLSNALAPFSRTQDSQLAE